MSVNFTARYMKKERLHYDELEEYFKVEQEQWERCNPLEWWVGCRAQFCNLFSLARDILTIPSMFSISHDEFMFTCITGSTVAVKRIFSGGRDTISLQCSSLHLKTIRTLMLVKQRLRLARL